MIRLILQRMQSARPNKRTHDLFCDCRRCMKNQFKYIKDLEKSVKGA